ncbi:hypothetical protein [Sphingomonas sp.]|nr:hypothetical protein [Sphingomonas sp.]HWK35571.1 hypothetical protein [Sphingomonas sp.]
MDGHKRTIERTRAARQPWRAPRVTKLSAGAAENGLLLGHELAVLLS